jgi:hypothetical protein
MKLSLSEASTALGKSERQVRYLIKSGHLRAGKEENQWRIDSAVPPLTEPQRRARRGPTGGAPSCSDALSRLEGET